MAAVFSAHCSFLLIFFAVSYIIKKEIYIFPYRNLAFCRENIKKTINLVIFYQEVSMLRRILALMLSLMLLLPAALAESLPFVQECIYTPGEKTVIRYTLPQMAVISLALYDGENQTAVILSGRKMIAGNHALELDENFFSGALTKAEYTLVLTVDGAAYTAPFRLEGNLSAATETPVPAPTAAPAPVQAVVVPPPAEVTPQPAANMNSVITPAYESAYHPEHENCYWCTPMDITDEEAVWNMLIAPVKVIDAKQKEQVILYAEPSTSSEKIGVVTGASQAVHVLEKAENGWVKVETYSSSFHDSRVKAWNKFVTGYLKESQLKTYTPRTDYGMVVDKLTQKLYIFKDGALFTTLAVSTGLYNERQPYNETRSGEFLIISRTGDFKSDNLICAKALRFNGGDLLHEVPHVLNADGSKNYKNCEPKLGTRASHGCIRVQRLKNAEGINMTWIWNNIKVGTKMVVWEDYQGRQIDIPADDTPLYYNANGGSNYHSTANCNGVKDKYLPLSAFTYGELDSGDYADLTVCRYCYPPLRKSEIAAINEEHLTASPGMVPQHLRQDD